MPSQKPQISIVVDPGLIARLDDFKCQHRFSSRAAAVNWLLEWRVARAPLPLQGSRRKWTGKNGMTWTVVVDLPRGPVTGKGRQKRIRAKSKIEAERPAELDPVWWIPEGSGWNALRTRSR